DGKYYKIKRFHEIILDGNLDWQLPEQYNGYKVVRVNGIAPNSITRSGIVVKYDGKILYGDGSGNTSTAPDLTNQIGGGNLFISLDNNNTGWGNNYTPTPEEIKAYFNGWKMYQRGQPSNVPYNGVGEKAWGA